MWISISSFSAPLWVHRWSTVVARREFPEVGRRLTWWFSHVAARDVESSLTSPSSFLACGVLGAPKRRCGFDGVAFLVAVSLSSRHLCGGLALWKWIGSDARDKC